MSMRITYLKDHDGHKAYKDYFVERTLARRLCENGVALPYITYLDSIEKATEEALEKKKAYLKTLPLKKFEAWKPAKVFRAVVDEEYLKNFASPPIVSGLSDEEAKRIKKLLLKKRDIATIRAEIKKEAAEKAAAEKKKAELVKNREKVKTETAISKKAKKREKTRVKIDKNDKK